MMANPQNHYVKRIVTVLCVFLVVHIAALLLPAAFRWADTPVNTLFFYMRNFFRGTQPVSPYLLLFALDDSFEKQYNTPARERIKTAEALENLRATGARTILLDIIFRERDISPDADIRLLEATRSSGNVFYPLNASRSAVPGETFPEFLSDKALWDLKVTRQGNPVKVGPGITPFRELCRQARGLGGITLFPESDGIIHRIPMVYACDDKFIPSLVLAGICNYFHVEPVTVSIAFGKYITLPGAVLPGGGVKEILIPVDKKGQLIVNYTGSWKDSITSYSLENILPTAAETNMRKMVVPATEPPVLVLIGDITTSGKDISRGIFDANYPMAGIIHNSLNTILTGNYLHQPSALEQMGVSFILLALIFLAGFVRKDLIQPGWLLAVFITYIVVVFILFAAGGRLPDISLHFLAFTCSGLLIFRQEIKEIKQLIIRDDELKIPDIKSREPAAEKESTAIPQQEDPEQQTSTMRLKELKLSTTQIAVAIPLLAGLQYREIADRLKIGVQAVGRRINRIYRKLGVNNKIEFSNVVSRKKNAYNNSFPVD